MYYQRSDNTFHLLDDGGNDQPATNPGGGSISNSRCTLNGTGAGAVVSGNNLIVTFPMTFSQLVTETENLIGFVRDTTGNQSNYVTLGTWTNAGAPPVSVPDLVSLTPSAGSGTSGTFTAIYRHPDGESAHYHGYMLFLPLPNVVSFNAKGTCLIEYNRLGGRFDGKGGMRLIDNAGTGWLGRLVGEPVGPGTPPLMNTACTVNVAGTQVSFSGTDMILTVPVTFNPAGVTQVMGTFIQSNDIHDYWTDFRQFGNWSVPGAGVKPGPFVGGVTPTSGAGSTVTFGITGGHTSGVGQIGQVHFRMNAPTIVGGSPCHAVYFPLDNTVALVNDAGTGIVGPVPLGTAIDTDRCSIGAGATSSSSGSTVTVNLPMTFRPGMFGGAKNMYVDVFDVNGAVSHWVQSGTWIVQ
jgi:hypothetical protein